MSWQDPLLDLQHSLIYNVMHSVPIGVGFQPMNCICSGLTLLS